MLFVMSFIDNSFRTLKLLRQKLEAEQEAMKRAVEKGNKRNPLEVSAFSSQFHTAFLDLGMALEECQYLEGNTETLMGVLRIYPTLFKQVANAKTIEDYLDILNLIVEPLLPWIEGQSIYRYSWYDYDYIFRNLWQGYGYDTSDFGYQAIDLFQNAVQWKNRPINLFNMNCCASDHIQSLNNPKSILRKYGMDSRKALTNVQRTNYTRVIFGNYKGSMISREVFDIITCLPTLTQNKAIKNNVIVKNEQDLVQRGVDYLREGGILFFALPYYRYYNTLCTFIARNFENVQVFTTQDTIDLKANLVYVVGTKRSTLPLPDMKIYRILRSIPLRWKEFLDPKIKQLNPIELPEGITTIERFRGSELNEEEISELFNSSRCTADFWKAQKVEKLSESQVRPLLPFNIGQLGLVLTSGCLDGIVDEGNGYKHVVKGRVVKRVDRFENFDQDTNRIQVESTTSNRVEINAFLADGTYKCLA